MPRGRKSPESAKKPDISSVPEASSEELSDGQLDLVLTGLEDQIAQRAGKAEGDVIKNGDQLAMLEDMEMDLLLNETKTEDSSQTTETSVDQVSSSEEGVVFGVTEAATDQSSNEITNGQERESEFFANDEVIQTSRTQIINDVNDLSESEPEDVGEKAGEIAEERTNERPFFSKKQTHVSIK